MPDVYYLFKTDVPASRSDEWFRYVAKQRTFVADPSYSREFIFALEKDGEVEKLVGCLGMYTTQICTFWIIRQDDEVGTGMAVRLAQRVFQNFKQFSHLKTLIFEKDTWEQGRFEAAGFSFTGEIRPSPSGNYKVYTIARFEEANNASRMHPVSGRSGEKTQARKSGNSESPHTDKGKAPDRTRN